MTCVRLARLAALTLIGACFSVGATLPTVPTVVAEAPPSYGWAGFLQAAVGLVLVVALILFCAWAVRRFGLQTGAGNRFLKVISSVMVGQRERVVIVEVGDSWLVLGVAAGRVNALHTMSAQGRSQMPLVEADNAEPSSAAFSKSLRERFAQFNQLRKKD